MLSLLSRDGSDGMSCKYLVNAGSNIFQGDKGEQHGKQRNYHTIISRTCQCAAK